MTDQPMSTSETMIPVIDGIDWHQAAIEFLRYLDDHDESADIPMTDRQASEWRDN